LKILLLLLLLSPFIYGQAPTLKKADVHDHLSRSRKDHFDHERLRPPVKITLYGAHEITVAYIADGVLYNETYIIDKDSALNMGKDYLCPKIDKPCNEFWVLICTHPSHNEKPRLTVITPLTPHQIIKK
jgi:hypothetical protein